MSFNMLTEGSAPSLEWQLLWYNMVQ